MSVERRPLSAPEAKPAPEFEPTARARALVDAALDLIQDDGTVLYRKGTPQEQRIPRHRPLATWPFDNNNWVEKVPAIADTLFWHLVRHQESDPVDLYILAQYLSNYSDDPSLIDAAVSFVRTDEAGHPLYPLPAIYAGDWKTRVLTLRRR